MRLATREWGERGPVVLLVHGILSDGRTWRLVGPALAERGYRVVAVDLRGHGASAHVEDYSPAAYAADLVETVDDLAERPALAIGHSLGGLALALAVDGLRPERAVYVDPAWRWASLEEFDPGVFVRFADNATAESVSAANPRWAPEDVEVELATLACWDRRTADALYPLAGRAAHPASAVVPSLIMLADDSYMLTADEAATMRERGFEVRVVPGAGHTVHRDDLDGFMTALDGWA
ncbi:alpha/beta fold hydrolase [Actinospica robiniae]|uniref:alpha/beta fold hydrolase n=1 Tax=Actinospica robiniae TaxID=304901 RepID=UPI000428DFB2|nr:alpha/beta hydrolase [Actinospica robiniae]